MSIPIHINGERNRGTRSKVLGFIGHAAEAIAGIVFGLIAFLAGERFLGELIGFIGATQSLGRALYTNALREQFEPVQNIASVIDLTKPKRERQFQEMAQAFLHITEPELKQVRDVITRDASEKLRMLAEERSAELEAGEFYDWLLPMMRNVPAGTRVWAVSMMLETEWDGSAVERTFLDLTLAAAKRGVIIQRVFVVHRSKLDGFANNEGVRAHIAHRSKFLDPYIAERRELEHKHPALLGGLGDGMIAFGDRVVLVDASASRATRGRVSMKREDIQKWRGHFDSLVNHARPLTDAEIGRWRAAEASPPGNET